MVAAAFHLIREGGPAAVTYSALATESGVGRATIYRHWPTLDTLWPEIIEEASRQMPLEPSGDLRTDLVSALGFMADRMGSAEERVQFLSILEHAQWAEASESLVRMAQESNPLWRILSDAVVAGALPRDTDLDLASALLIGPVFHRGLFRGSRPDADFVEAVVDRYLAYDAATATERKRKTKRID